MSYYSNNKNMSSRYSGDRSRSARREPFNKNSSNYNEQNNRSARNYSLKTTSQIAHSDQEEYDDCRDIYKEKLRPSRRCNDSKSTCITRSPMKRSNQEFSCSSRTNLNKNNDGNDEDMVCSPKKRHKAATTVSDENTKNIIIKRFNMNNSNENYSPKKGSRSLSLCYENEKKNKYASTPKSERKPHVARVKELIQQNSINMERNMSNNWADIIDELDAQSKELDEYVEKYSKKFNLDKEKLLRSVESTTEVLRKRQKQINFGKITTEYQRYILAIPKKERKPYHPKTPNKFRKCSRRKFDGLVKKWRKLLHVWDETPDLLPEYKSSIDLNEGDEYQNVTDEFGGASNITDTNFSYNIDDYDLIDSEPDENKLIIDAV